MGKGRTEKELCPSFSSFLLSMGPLFSSWPGSAGVMINTTTHGKRMTDTMETVVLVGRIADRPVQASQALPGVHGRGGARGWGWGSGGFKMAT